MSAMHLSLRANLGAADISVEATTTAHELTCAAFPENS